VSALPFYLYRFQKLTAFALVKGKWDRRDISANIIDYKHLHTQDSHWHFGPYSATIAPINRVSRYLGGGFKGVMNQNIEVITYAVSLIFKAAIIAVLIFLN